MTAFVDADIADLRSGITMAARTLGIAVIDVVYGATRSDPQTLVVYDGAQFVPIGTIDPTSHTFAPAYSFASPDVILAGTDTALPVNSSGVAAAVASIADADEADAFVTALIFG